MYVLRSCSVATSVVCITKSREGKEESIQSQVVNSQSQQPQHFIPAQHCMEGMGEEKLYFPLLKSEKRQKVPLGRRFSTHFVASCR